MVDGDVAFEVTNGGGRGSTKSEGGYGCVMKGNIVPRLPRQKDGSPHPYDISYLNNPNFNFLVLRKNADDLSDWFERALKVFKPFGVKGSREPFRLRFPSGAYGVLGHMDTEDAYEKWQGQEFVKIIFEEIQQCRSEQLYLRITASCRSPHKELVAQVYNTANPGGIGNRWINARFRYTPGGKPIPHGTIYKDPRSGRGRVFFHSTVLDNPYYCTYKNGERDEEADDYARGLELLANNEYLYRQWVLGDFDCFSGSYFPEFRREPMGDEPAHAYHVVDRVELDDWWPRAIGLDWGFAHPSAVVWGCWHPEGRLYIYDELSVEKTGSVELGTLIAKKTLPALEKMPGHHITIYAGHDCFWRKDEGYTIADQIAEGINEVLGRNASFVLHPNADEKSLPEDEAWASVKRRQAEQVSSTVITITRASNDRVGGWSLIRNLLNWKKLHPESLKVNEEYAAWIAENKGVLAEREYRDSLKKQRNEIVPKIRFLKECDSTIRSLTSLVHDEKKNPEDAQKVDGDDESDALRYLVVEFPFQESAPPRNVWMRQEMAKKGPVDDTQRYIQAAVLESKWKKEHQSGRGCTIPRNSGRRSRLVRMGLG